MIWFHFLVLTSATISIVRDKYELAIIALLIGIYQNTRGEVSK